MSSSSPTWTAPHRPRHPGAALESTPTANDYALEAVRKHPGRFAIMGKVALKPATRMR